MRLIHGDCVEAMRGFEPASVDAVVCDPPYAIAFMSSAWDSHSSVQAFQEWCEKWSAEALRVLKPGGFLLAFGGTRTYHRLVCGVEDAGFEIRDTIAWVYGSGFPKSLNVARATESPVWDGWGTALKPAHEPIVVARKSFEGTVAANVLAHGVGGLNIDGCRIEGPAGDGNWKGTNVGGKSSFIAHLDDGPRDAEHELGRWPANFVVDEEAAELLDAQTGELQSGVPGIMRKGVNESAAFGAESREPGTAMVGYGDSGGASRFFYCAKVSRAERNAGLEGFDPLPLNWSSGEQNPGSFQSDGTDRKARNHHPTVKPISLMRWLVRLVTPPGGLVLDPFLGSGSTGCAASLEGFEFVGVEQRLDYLMVAAARIAFWKTHGAGGLELVARVQEAEDRRQAIADAGQLDLLGSS